MNIRVLQLTLLSITLVFSSLAQATIRDSQFNRCSEISDDVARLACFDTLADTVENKTAEKNTAEKKIIAVETVQNQQKAQSFGQEHLKKTSEQIEKASESITFVISKIKKLNYDKLQISFENGQVWRQSDSTSIRLRIGDSVKLSRGFASVIYLQKVGSSKRIRIKRVK